VKRIKSYNYLTKKQFKTIREDYSCRVRKFMWNLKKNCLFCYDVDVLVCGGGPSGIAAAVSAAKNGAEVLLIERFNCLGGQGTVGLVTSFMSMSAYTGGRQVIKGVFEEFTNLLEEMGGCIKPPHLAEERPYFSVNRHEAGYGYLPV